MKMVVPSQSKENTILDNVVYFAHGKESGPWGTKIQALADIARSKQFHVESPDYSGINDPEERVAHLLSYKPTAKSRLVLVGSSMGAYVSAAAAEVLKPAGLFLMAPAIGIEGFGRQDLQPCAEKMLAVHGWQDELIPPLNIVNFCERHKIELHLLNSDHRLIGVLDKIELLFSAFLEDLLIRKSS